MAIWHDILKGLPVRCSPMPTFSYNNANLCYFVHDERDDKSHGFPVVFVHGAGSFHDIWRFQVREFKKTHRVITFDLSGHGCSDMTDEEITIADFAKELNVLIEHLDLHDFVLVGHSMGGGVVMSYVLNPAFRQPRAIVLVDTSYDLDLTKLTPGLAIEFVEEMVFRLTAKLKRQNSEALDILNAEQEMRRRHPKMFPRDLKACHIFDIRDRLGEITVPTFVLHGTDDDVIRPGYAQELEDALPRADIALIRDSNHQPMIEQPKRFNELLRKYLNWVESST